MASLVPDNIPDISERPVFFGYPVQERVVLQPAIPVGRKITNLILTPYVNHPVGTKPYGPYYCFIRQRKKVPVFAIETEQPFVVGEIKDVVLVLRDVPALQSRPVSLFGIVDHVRQPDRVLGMEPQGKQTYNK